jgi:hypothetical protein
MSRSSRLISAAVKKISPGDSRREALVGAVLARGGRVLSSAENSSKPRRPYSPKGAPPPLLP